MMNKRHLVFSMFLFLAVSGCFAQKISFVAQAEGGIYLNPEYKALNSAPSPITFQLSLGAQWPASAPVALQPMLTFFMMNHLWYDGKALPAEIENRTSTTLCFLAQIPAVFSFALPNSKIQLLAGAGVMIRYAFLAHGVSSDDSGFSGTASDDISLMNEWFWSDLRWLYLTAGVSWLFSVHSKLSAGPLLDVSIPVGGLVSDHSAQGLIISAGIRICR